jgi:hypothetical protein
VNFAVGGHAPNKPDDVMLVQWMLHRVCIDHPRLVLPPESDDLAIDGFIGKHTITWITAFQANVRRLGQRCALDGRVDSARKSEGSISHAPYTMLRLNSLLRSSNPAVFFNPASDPDMPTALLAALATNTGAAGPSVPKSRERCRPSLHKTGGPVVGRAGRSYAGWFPHNLAIHSDDGSTSLRSICWAQRIERCSSSAVTSPAELESGSVPVASLRNSTLNPRWTAWRAVVSQHIWVM